MKVTADLAFNRGLTDDSKGIGYPSIGLTRHDVTAAHYEWIPATHVVTLIDGLIHDEPTWRCHQNPFIGALGILPSSPYRLHKSEANNQQAFEEASKELVVYSFIL